MLVPDPVKLTVIQLIKKLASPREEELMLSEAARLLAYCILGHEQFTASNSARTADQVDHRIEEALEAGDSLDAKLILLALHSGLISPEVADRIDLEDT